MTSPILSPTDGKLNLVAVDTSTAIGSVAVGGFSRCWNKLAMHSEIAVLEFQNLLDEARLKLPDIQGFAVNVGPGSFTGLRVGINLVKTLAYALEKPVAMFSSLEALAFENLSDGESAMIAIKAIQNYYYAAAYEKGPQGMKTLVEPHSATLAEIRGKAGGLKLLVEEETAPLRASDAKTLVAMSANASFSSWKCVKPLYVRGSEAEEKLRKGLLKPLP